jgi:hypothetical protein
MSYYSSDYDTRAGTRYARDPGDGTVTRRELDAAMEALRAQLENRFQAEFAKERFNRQLRVQAFTVAAGLVATYAIVLTAVRFG